MEDPLQDVAGVVHRLTQGSPKVQEQAINQYFTPNASFTHPFCRTGSFDNSRALIHSIFRWYKVMSPKIELTINSVAYDETHLILYVNISQVFAIWFLPFHRSPVTLTTQLQLTRFPGDRKYYIASQNDLYQVDQFVRFFAPWGIGTTLVLLWHFVATFACVLLAYVSRPFTALMQKYDERGSGERRLKGRETTVDRARELAGSEGANGVESAGGAEQFGSLRLVKAD